VDQIAVCGWGEVESPDPEVARALSAGQIDWIAAPSAAAARALIRLYGQAVGGAKLASIGPSTSTALRELGIEPAAEASGRAGAGLVEAILRFGRGEG
jgi:uroporphyrinogen-III synthase